MLLFFYPIRDDTRNTDQIEMEIEGRIRIYVKKIYRKKFIYLLFR